MYWRRDKGKMTRGRMYGQSLHENSIKKKMGEEVY